MEIKVTVVIPTRERADTLIYCIRTALDQQSKNYQVLVSDNFSFDNTMQVVKSFNDERLTYVNPGERLSMTDHWNFAMKYVQGEYVIIIGDDDAIMPNSIDRFIGLTETHQAKIFTWPSQVYFWPSKNKNPHVPFVTEISAPSKIDLKIIMNFVQKYGLVNYSKLPHFYHSAVHRDIISTIKEKTGNIFSTSIPDVYMSYMLPAFSEYAINLGYPISIVGHSPNSNSGSLLEGNIDITNNFFKEYKNIEFCNEVPLNFSEATNNMLNTFFIARNYCKDFYRDINYNFSRMIAFQYVTLKIESITKIFRNRKLIAEKQNFNFLEFILFIFLFKFYIFTRHKFRFNKQRAYNFNNDKNIYTFVNSLSKLL